jgi:hypothetical protein
MDWKSEDVGVIGKDGVIVQGWGDALDLCAFPCRVMCHDNHPHFPHVCEGEGFIDKVSTRYNLSNDVGLG